MAYFKMKEPVEYFSTNTAELTKYIQTKYNIIKILMNPKYKNTLTDPVALLSSSPKLRSN